MIVALSSSAAPRATLAELAEGCARRGIFALHLVEGHGHGIRIEASVEELREAGRMLEQKGVRIAAIEIACLSEHGAERGADVCEFFGARLVTACTSCADVNAAQENVNEALLSRPDVDLITLRGAGPEAAQHEGRGIGALMSRLSLSGYRGILALAPSSAAVLPVWRTWLNQGKAWGCGSKTADPSLVQLA